MITKTKPNVYKPKRSGEVTAVLWTGKASCLIGMPEFDEIIASIQEISSHGFMHIRLDSDGSRKEDEDDRNSIRVRPNQDYIVVHEKGRIDVWQEEYLKANYDPVPTVPPEPVPNGTPVA